MGVRHGRRSEREGDRHQKEALELLDRFKGNKAEAAQHIEQYRKRHLRPVLNEAHRIWVAMHSTKPIDESSLSLDDVR